VSKISHEPSERGGGTYAIRWRARSMAEAIQQAMRVELVAYRVGGARLARLSLHDKPKRGRAVDCSAFIDVTDQRVFQEGALRVPLRALLP
jgi:hypothetical protein